MRWPDSQSTASRISRNGCSGFLNWASPAWEYFNWGGLVEQPFWYMYSRLQMLSRWPLGDWIPDRNGSWHSEEQRMQHTNRIRQESSCPCYNVEYIIIWTKSRKLVVGNFEGWRYAPYNQERDIAGVSMKGERAEERWIWKEIKWQRWMATHTLGLQC